MDEAGEKESQFLRTYVGRRLVRRARLRVKIQGWLRAGLFTRATHYTRETRGPAEAPLQFMVTTRIFFFSIYVQI